MLAAQLSATLPQATLHPPPSVKTTMMRGIYLAYMVILVAYFPVAICGYLAFGSSVDPDVLLSVGKPAWLTRAANFMVVIHVGASWQVRRSSNVVSGLLLHGWMQPCARLRTQSCSLWGRCTYPAWAGWHGWPSPLRTSTQDVQLRFATLVCCVPWCHVQECLQDSGRALHACPDPAQGYQPRFNEMAQLQAGAATPALQARLVRSARRISNIATSSSTPAPRSSIMEGWGKPINTCSGQVPAT